MTASDDKAIRFVFFGALVLTWLALSSASAAAQRPAGILVLKRANVLDGISDRPMRGVTVVVRDGRIVTITRASIRLPRGAEVIDLAGMWLLPGFIDAHVHIRDAQAARKALSHGVTSARSLGGPHFADIDLRERHRAGAVDLPDILAAGYHVRRRLAPEFFLDAPQLSGLKSGLRSQEDVRLVVSTLAGREVDLVKVMATERAGLVETDPLRRVLNDDELTAATAEAKKAGLPVAAHAHSDEGARAAVLAGAQTIEHGTLLTDATLKLMKQRGVCLVPTISFWRDMMDPAGEYDHPKLRDRASAMLPRIRQTVAGARRIGVTVAAGSDMRYDAESVLVIGDEIAELINAGMTFGEALRAGTSAAANCLGISRRTGAIKIGLEADMIVVERDPRRDARQLHEPYLVVNNGQVSIDRRKQKAN